MKYLSLFLVLFFVSISCNKNTCGLADKYAKKYTTGIADRWACDYDKVYADMKVVLNKTICKETPIEGEFTPRITITGDIAMMACTAVTSAISKFGSEYIASKWGCDASKVAVDLEKLSMGCGLIGLL